MAKGSIIPEGKFEENGGETLSEGSAGAIEDGTKTFDVCKDLVDQWVEVTEEEIEKSIVGFFKNHHKVIEGAPAVAVASYIKIHEQYKNKAVAIVICGANL